MDKKISFGFTSTAKAESLKTKSVINETKEDLEETDFVKSVDGTDVKSVKEAPQKKGPLIIPIILKNNWRRDSTKALSLCDSVTNGTGDAKDNVSRAAARELIEDARRRENEEEDETENTSNLAIPLLLQNQVPDGFETDDKVDTELRPAESTLEDYEEVPIEHFGLALLRGMGWSEGQGIGKNKQNVKPIEAQLRPKGMGLGADKSSLLQDKNKSGRKQKLKPGDKREEEETLELKKGAHCVILKGPHTDLYATVQGVDDDNCRCAVKLSLSQESVDISQFSLRLVTKQDFDKYSRYLNKGKSDRYKDMESNKRDGSPAAKKQKSETNGDSRSKNRDKHKSSSNSLSKQPKNWIQPLLKVKVIDRKYKDGRYYSSKVLVYDVLPDSIVCKTDSGRLLEGLRENQLETVIPREDKSHVMIVSGEYKKEVGELIQHNRDKERVTVQLLSDRGTLVTLHYDEVCEYTGSVDSLPDY